MIIDRYNQEKWTNLFAWCEIKIAKNKEFFKGFETLLEFNLKITDSG